MHFVKKVPTTEEEAAEKARITDAKKKAFIAMRDAIFSKRGIDGEEQSQLEQTGTMLSKNPDIYTLWNIRRAAIESLEKKLNEENVEEAAEKITKLLEEELSLTQKCLRENPKSYAAWHQRSWVLDRHPAPKIEADLKLCSMALQMDCRNFHTWDHRRYLAALAKLPLDEEIEFSNKVIEENFSNFSAWHYRGILLKKRYQNQQYLDEDTVSSEFKKVITACCTDPNDQSGWTYSRFLLDHVRLENDYQTEACEVVAAALNNNGAVVSFRSGVTKECAAQWVSADKGAVWTPITTLPTKRIISSKIWRIETNNLAIVKPDVEKVVVTEGHPYVDRKYLEHYFYRKDNGKLDFLDEYTPEIEQILAEEEKPCPVGLYSLTAYMIRTTPRSSTERILANLEELARVDPQRKNFYLSIRDRHVVGDRFAAIPPGSTKDAFEEFLTSGVLHLNELQLTSLDFLWPLAPLVKKLDVEKSEIKRSLDAKALFPLIE
ncbi:unnamed protein product, partial [Mesorhabditis spiculigera]